MFSPYGAPLQVQPQVGPLVHPIAQLGLPPELTEQRPQPPEMSLPRMANYLADLGGCAHYRVLWPEQAMNAMGMTVSHSNTAFVGDPNWYHNLKCVQVQRQASGDHMNFMRFLKEVQQQVGFKIIYNIDDVPFKEHIPDYNTFKFAFDSDEIRQNCIDLMNMSDEVVVTCDYMRDIFQEITGKKEITVIPNYPPHSWIGHCFDKQKIYNNFERHKRKPRILYTGSGAHFDVTGQAGFKDDFEHMIKFIVDNISKYQWVFLGGCPIPLAKYARTKQIEVHPWIPLHLYPRYISKLDVQMTIAPLQNNSFNKAKSDIKYVESAMLGIPCLLQDIETYHTAPADIRFGSIDEFKFKLEQKLNPKNRKRWYAEVSDGRAYGETRFLELPQNLNCWFELQTTPFGDPSRVNLKRYNP